MDPLANAYLKVITESSDDLQSKDQKVAGQSLKVGAAFGDSKNDSTVKKVQPKSGPEAEGAETPQNAQEAPSNLSVGKEEQESGKAKPLGKTYGEASNPFDALFNKIISEEGQFMDFATSPDENPSDSTFEPSMEESDEFGEDEEEGEEVTFTLSRELAEQLHEVLSSVLSEEGEEGEESEEGFGEESSEGFGEESSEEESSEMGAKPFGEAVEAEEQGHALVDAEKLNKGMTAKGNMVVKGAVPVTKKTAQTPSTGKGHDGKLKSHSTEGGVSKLTAKSNDVGGVKVGKTLFDND
jgi:hypothetical protein